MARMPGAEWLGEHSPGTLMGRIDIVCVHTIVGYAPAHAAHFSTTGGGRLYQSRDTRFQSAANLHGNPRIIAIENEDHGDAFAGMPRGREGIPPLTDAQVQRCAEVLAWAHEEDDVPLQLCPNSRPGSRGLAYHRQGIDGDFDPPTYRFPGRVPGGEVWTEYPGKVCPTDLRIAQLPEILAIARAITEGDDMTPDQAKDLADTRAGVNRLLAIAKGEKTRDQRIAERLAKGDKKRADEILAAIADVDKETA